MRAIEIFDMLYHVARSTIPVTSEGKGMKKRDSYRVGSLIKTKGVRASNWRPEDRILRIAKRKKTSSWGHRYTYFVVSVGHPVGAGMWLNHGELEVLTPLEQLAAQSL